jgi:cytoskeletal protein RodZ
MSIEGLGKKFQEARKARGLTLDEAARLTKIRQSRLAEIEADDYSNFPNLAYAKGFLQIYGKFLQVDVSPFLETFETSGHMTVDGYSYLQDNKPSKPVRTPVARRDGPPRTSIMPLIIGLAVLFVGFWLVRLLLNVQRIAPRQTQTEAAPTPGATVASITAPRAQPVEGPPQIAATTAPTRTLSVPAPTATPAAVAAATPVLPSPSAVEPEVRRAQPVRPAELAAALASNSASGSTGGENRVDIKPLRKTYMQVTVEDDPTQPAFERWVSPSDGVVQFHGRRISVRVLDREAVQIRKNGKIVSNSDADLRIE